LTPSLIVIAVMGSGGKVGACLGADPGSSDRTPVSNN
jgi:hypothetical protein